MMSVLKKHKMSDAFTIMQEEKERKTNIVIFSSSADIDIIKNSLELNVLISFVEMLTNLKSVVTFRWEKRKRWKKY